MWVLGLGWRPGLLFSAADGLDYVYPVVHFVRENTKDIYYDPSWLGGTKVAGAWVTPWFLRLVFLTGASGATAMFLTMAIPQVLLAFSLLKIVDALGAGGHTHEFWAKRVAWILLMAFPPFLAWRFLAGHLFYFSLLAPATLALASQLARERLTITSALLLTATLAGSLQGPSYQQLISAAYVITPLLLVLAWRLKPGRAALATFAGICVAALLFVLPQQAEMWMHFTGPDASRSEHGAAIVYSFLVSGWRDWVGTFFWQLGLWSYGRPALEVAETNFAWGPLLVFLSAGCWRGPSRTLFAAFGVVLVVMAAFASALEPFSTVVLWLAYPLQFFRGPMRALLPLSFLLPAFAALCLSGREGRGKLELKWRLATGCGLALAIYFLPPLGRELAGWAIAAALLLPQLRERCGSAALLLPLALASVMAFGQRLPAPQDLARTAANVNELREKILSQAPDLKDPLVRATVDFQDGKFRNNTSHIIGLSTLDGYWQPLRAYSEITSRAYGVPLSPFMLNFRISNTEPGARELFRLFNVKYRVRTDETGAFLVENIGTQSQSARLLEEGSERPCGAGEVKVTTLDPYFRAEASFSPLAQSCELVWALTHSQNLHAYAPDGSRLLTAPALGGLFAVKVPQGISRVAIQAEAMAPGWMAMAPLVGLLLWLLSAGRWLRFRRR